MTGDRYHLTLHADGRPIMHGWWSDRATADRKFRTWIGEHGNVDGARVTLVDEETGQVIHRWPETA